jgi:hypothetical protein
VRKIIRTKAAETNGAHINLGEYVHSGTFCNRSETKSRKVQSKRAFTLTYEGHSDRREWSPVETFKDWITVHHESLSLFNLHVTVAVLVLIASRAPRLRSSQHKYNMKVLGEIIWIRIGAKGRL